MKEYIITSKKYGKFSVLLDDDDYYYFIKNNITLSLHNAKKYKIPYIQFKATNKNGTKKLILLHRFITKAPANKMVDHINRNPLDNRKENLRFCTNFENCQNHKEKDNGLPVGVGIHKHTGKYRAYICKGDKQISLGYFKTKEEAIKAREEYVRNKPW